jgi:hypothetical protein
VRSPRSGTGYFRVLKIIDVMKLHSAAGCLIVLMIFAISFALQGCYYDVEEELYPASDSNCDTSSVTYSQTVVPLLNNNCMSCHSQASAQGGIILEGYANVKTYADNGRLLGAVKWDAGFSPMPQGGNKLNNCAILQLETWVNAGAPEN